MKSTHANINILFVLLAALFISTNNINAQEQPPEQILIINAQVFDGINEKLTPANILIEGKFIKTISSDDILPDQNVTVIDATGLTLMPGLIEGHGHLQMNGSSLADIENNLNWEQIDDVLELVEEFHMDGIVATNTTITRAGLITAPEKIEKIGRGGLSGKPIRERSTEIIRYISKEYHSQTSILFLNFIV